MYILAILSHKLRDELSPILAREETHPGLRDVLKLGRYHRLVLLCQRDLPCFDGFHYSLNGLLRSTGLHVVDDDEAFDL